jgi:hypothetical protein
LNLTELARATGIPKSSFYQNPQVKQCLEAARLAADIGRQGAVAPSVPVDAPALDAGIAAADKTASNLLERRVHRLEQQNGALVAENFELRRQVKELRLQLGREDMMIETGRRVVSPTGEA